MNHRLPLPIQVSRGPRQRFVAVGFVTVGFAAAMLCVVIWNLCLLAP